MRPKREDAERRRARGIFCGFGRAHQRKSGWLWLCLEDCTLEPDHEGACEAKPAAKKEAAP
jgi:hypothetical protein